MKANDFNLIKALEFHPEAGNLLLGKNRMLLFRQEALATLRKLLVEQLGEGLSRSILTQFGFRCGREDHQAISKHYQWDSEAEELASGPVLHTWEGLVRAEPTLIDFDRAKGHFHMKGRWINSYEATLYLSEFGPATGPVCHTLVGYASGWCTSFFGQPLLAIEPTCRAKGDEMCSFEIRPEGRWGSEAEPFRQALAQTTSSLTRELEDKLSLIESQRAAIAQLSTPIIQVWDEILCLPIVGTIDTARSSEMTDRMLDAVVRQHARAVIVDITGIDMMDTKTADHFIKMAKAVRLLGAEPILTGISPSIAQTLTHIGVDLDGIRTLRSLRDALSALLQKEVIVEERASEHSHGN
ncbi:MAG: XylR N-terminal domain-containing protein [Deltaproteobacteria bacterium]|nr:XylR N-terminal domain-containing protein [Deltaproteobacteria bacterium]